MALRVADLGVQEGHKQKKTLNERIHPDYPYLKSEILYAIRHEMVEKPNDILCRRIPIAFLNKKLAADLLLPEITDILAQERKWSPAHKKQELEEATKLIEYMK